MPATPTTTFEVSHRGDIGAHAIERATDKVTRVAGHCREPVNHVEVRLTLYSEPRHTHPAAAEATLDIDGVPVRAHVAADDINEAIDLLVDRLRRRVGRQADRRHRLAERHRNGHPDDGEWRHGDQPVDRPPFAEVPFGEREVRRHKTFAMHPMSVVEAAFDLESLDHDFYLFVEESTGSDAIVRRTSRGTLEVIVAGAVPLDPSRAEAIPIGSASVPHLSLTDAKEHLDATDARYLFHVAGEAERGRVLYRRFDGHYGLVTSG